MHFVTIFPFTFPGFHLNYLEEWYLTHYVQWFLFVLPHCVSSVHKKLGIAGFSCLKRIIIFCAIFYQTNIADSFHLLSSVGLCEGGYSSKHQTEKNRQEKGKEKVCEECMKFIQAKIKGRKYFTENEKGLWMTQRRIYLVAPSVIVEVHKLTMVHKIYKQFPFTILVNKSNAEERFKFPINPNVNILNNRERFGVSEEPLL